MFKGVRHVIWDWNGTLFDDVDAAILSINNMLLERGLPILGKLQYRRIFGFPVIDCYRKLGFRFSSDAEWDAIAREFHDHYNRNAESAMLSEGVPELLAGLASAGIGMSVLSASESSMLEKLLDKYGIREAFRHVCGHSDLYGSSKVGLGRRLMERLDSAPEEVLLIGDTTHDFEVASDLGCRCLLHLEGHQDAGRLEACGCSLISSFRGLMPCQP